MMGFTFLVGIAFAYLLKLMTFFLTGLNRKSLATAWWQSCVWMRAYRIKTFYSYNYIRSVSMSRECLAEFARCSQTQIGTSQTMDELAECHLGNCDTSEREDSEMKCLLEMHHGKI